MLTGNPSLQGHISNLMQLTLKTLSTKLVFTWEFHRLFRRLEADDTLDHVSAQLSNVRHELKLGLERAGLAALEGIPPVSPKKYRICLLISTLARVGSPPRPAKLKASRERSERERSGRQEAGGGRFLWYSLTLSLYIGSLLLVESSKRS
eukprot:scaffold17923_cov147-Skeletonema_menzelii.AAC.1